MKWIFGCLLMLGISQGVHAKSLIDQIDLKSNDRTDILAIYQHGQLIYEEYRNGYRPEQKHKLWSMSKTLTGLMVARAVEEGRLEVQDSICEYVSLSELPSVNHCEITIEKLLFWQSGVQWAENYIGLDGDDSAVLNGLYGPGIDDFSKYYFSLPLQKSHPHNWNYSTGDSHILSYILKKVHSPMEYEKLPWTRLFDPLQIEDATVERDHQGTYLGGAYIFLSHESLNKVAQFVLRERVSPSYFPKDWFENVWRAKSNAHLTQDMIKDAIAPAIPGGHWWLNRPSNAEIQTIPWPQAPEDTVAAFGVFGQMMFIIPSEELVIIRLAQDFKGGFDRINLVKVARQYAKEWQ